MPRTVRVAWRRLVATLIYCCAIPVDSAAAPPLPEAFGAMPAESDAVLSSDGHWLAWLDRKEAKPRVIMFDVPGGKVHRMASAPGG